MGTDITMYIEQNQRIRYGSDEREWKSREIFALNNRRFPVYDGRNYQIFSILAGVRSKGNVEPIANPRGIPEDTCEYIKSQMKEVDDYIYTTSYVTLKELLQHYEKYPKLKRTGMVSPDTAYKLTLGVNPQMWCGATNDTTWQYREWYDENTIIDLIERIISRIQLFDEYATEEEIKADGANIRIVFWFD